MVREFFIWWGEQLTDCIPRKWRRLGLSGDYALVIAPIGPIGTTPEAISVLLRSKGRENPLGRYALATGDLLRIRRPPGKPVVLRLREADLLSKTVTLPLAAERDIGQVLGFEMDRETPFRPEQIYWTYRVTRRDRQRGELSVQLLLVQRATLGPLLYALGEAGLVTKCAEIAAGPDEFCLLPLDPESDGHQSGRHFLRWPAAVLCAGLAVAVVAVPFVRQASAIAALDQEIAKGRLAA